MSYYNKLPKNKKQEFKKKYSIEYANEALVMYSLYQLHKAFGGELVYEKYKRARLPGAVVNTSGRGVLGRTFKQRTSFGRASIDNAAITKSGQHYPEGVEQPDKGDAPLGQALSLYASMNRRERPEDEINQIGPLTANSIQARVSFKQFLKNLKSQQGAPDVFGQLDFSDLASNLDEKKFRDVWKAMLDYTRIVGGKTINGVDQFYDHLRANNQTDGELFGSSFDTKGFTLFGLLGPSDEEERESAEKAQKAIAIAAKKEEQASFHEQFYLLSRIKELKKYNSSKQYRNFSFVRDVDPSRNLENMIYFSKYQDSIFEMTPIQLSALVPYFKFYLVYDHGDKKESLLFPFQGSHLNLQEVLKTRSKDLGFKDFSWSYEGKYYELEDKIIRSSITLFGSDLGVFDKEIGIIPEAGERRIKFEDLLTREYSISFRAVCGWAVPHSVDDRIISKNLRKAIKDTQITLDLGIPLTHTFSFNQDGTFELTINYTGRLNYEFENTNLLESKETMKKKALSEFDLDILKKFKKVSSTEAFNKDKALTVDAVNSFIEANFKDSQVSLEVVRSRFLKLIEGESDLTKATNLVNRLLKDKTVEVRSNEAFSQVLKKIEQIDRVFYFSLNKDDLESYMKGLIEKKKQLSNPTPPPPTAQQLKDRLNEEKTAARNASRALKASLTGKTPEQVLAEEEAEFQKQVKIINENTKDLKEPQRTQARGAAIAALGVSRVGGITGIEEKEMEEKVKKRDRAAERKAISPATSQIKQIKGGKIEGLFSGRDLNAHIQQIIDSEEGASKYENFHIPFFFFGDLVESVLSIAGKKDIDKKNLRIILGGVAYRDNLVNSKTKGEAMYIPLVDVPISIRNYTSFIHKNYIQKSVINMSLNAFLTDSFNSLVRPVFSGKDALIDLPDFAKSSMAISSRYFTSDKDVSFGQITPDSLKSVSLKNSQENFDKSKSFVLFNGNKQIYPTEKATRRQDGERGISHLTLGRDRGIVKNASFTKHNYAFAITGRLVADESGKQSTIDKLREPYDVQLEMYGNNSVLNGTQLFLTPSVPGLEGAKVAARLGLGGYYTVIKSDNTISDTGFTTSVFAKNVAHPDAGESFARSLVRGDSTVSEEVKKADESLKKQPIKGKGAST